MRVLITGGAGFIGSHLCDLYISQGHQVEVLDNLSSGSKKNISHLDGVVTINKGDIRDKTLVENLVKRSDLILHMAAALGVEQILENPVDSISVNFIGSEVVLNAAVKFDKRIIIASTSEIYGKNPKQPLAETDDRIIGTPQKLRWSYSDSKALEEACAQFLYITQNLRVTTVRFFNTVGPRQTGKYGMVVPRFVAAAKSNNTLEIFGDGLQTRVFCHVSDAVSAISNLSLNEEAIGQVFNIGGIEEISIADLASRVIFLTKSKSKTTYIPYEKAYSQGFEDMQRRVPDLTKIKNLIGWKPKKSLEEIIMDVSNYEN
jgi:UDP-glucose 4-epimerase